MSTPSDTTSVADFRSDTVTKPTPAMRSAMAEAEVGDDVFGDDPTVNALEAHTASLFRREAALFCPTGTMANLVAIKILTQPGDELICESYSHNYNNEVGGAAVVAGVLTRTLHGPAGKLDPDEVERFARPGDLHQPRTSLLCVENTHNFYGGRVVPLDHLRALRDVANRNDMAVHLDGARLWNAITASDVPAHDWAAQVDTLTLCLSKGLGAPAGTLLIGDRAHIDQARRVRKMLGGGLRQVGVLAAAARLALDEGSQRLHEDHTRARRLAEQSATLPGADVDVEACETNIVFIRTRAGAPSYPPIVAGLAERGVRAIALGNLGIRFVTHRDVTDAHVDRALDALSTLVPQHGNP